MTKAIDVARAAAAVADLDADTQRLIEIEDAIANIRTQIAVADLTRQREGKPMDADWFHRARTALRHYNRERAEIIARQRRRRWRGRLKDMIIEVLRERHDSVAWAKVMEEALMRLARETRDGHAS